MSIQDFVDYVAELKEEIRKMYLADRREWVIAVSYGKDSTAVLQIVWNAIAEIPKAKREKTIHLITTDTTVENPIMSRWVTSCIAEVDSAAEAQSMPFQTHLIRPAIENRFWSILIGKGYSRPRNKFRWCTDRMKIQGSRQLMRSFKSSINGIVLILGTRFAESTARSQRMNKRTMLADRVSQGDYNEEVYTPIQDWSDTETWIFLNQWPAGFRADNKRLIDLYQGFSSAGECPIVTANINDRALKTKAAGCGARTGCWTCTVVNKDRSFTSYVNDSPEHEWMEPLLEFRDEINLENDHQYRDFRRRNTGKVHLYTKLDEDGNECVAPIPGPYLKEYRNHLFRRVLQVHRKIEETKPDEYSDFQVISIEEILFIRDEWISFFGEFDDAASSIYRDVMGCDLVVTKDNNRLLDRSAYEVLLEICGDDSNHLGLMASLLNTEDIYNTRRGRRGIYNDLEKCFERKGYSRDEAIKKAQQKDAIKRFMKDSNQLQLDLDLFNEKEVGE